MKDKKESVGVLIVSHISNRFLLLQRGKNINNPLLWGLLSGKMENNEIPLDSIKREIFEEVLYNPELVTFKKIGEEINENKIFHFFVGFIDTEL